ncbi:ABC transporter permease [Novosphingobium sp. YJ-S2-02]|uniref:ABC transporter permease n=1 Tax=Novosphingobium aureum TaxID=2792964 RepID=A0A931HFW6_9SPHN|nr:ABC transporter permease [Novosphingobium aureum]MBH0114658.1 ABC transporter permease [Novosphingobium aureum]
MSGPLRKEEAHSGRLSVLSAAWVIARRDFMAILFSRAFFFFLLGPLFPLIVGALAGSVGQRVQQTAQLQEIGVVMDAEATAAVVQAGAQLKEQLGDAVPDIVAVSGLDADERANPENLLTAHETGVAAILSGSLDAPVLSGPGREIEAWRGAVAMAVSRARSGTAFVLPEVALAPTVTSGADELRGRLRTAQSAQMLLFLLTMMLAGMVLSNLVEEKGNKIIEVLAAAIPMESVFLGKLFAMLGVSLVGIATWATVIGGVFVIGGSAMPSLTEPAVGWPMLFVLGVVYFSTAYLLLGSVFLAIGSLASTVREVQTLSMPVTMVQLLVFFLASYAMTQPGSTIEIVSLLFPFSAPFAMLARAAQDPALLPHLAAVLGQGAWVVLLVRLGSALFRKRVMKSGGAGARKGRGGGIGRLFRRKAASQA